MGKIVVIEGLDGSGKQTQSEMLCGSLKYINKKNNLGLKIGLVSFPNYDSYSSDLVKHYINNDLPNDIPVEMVVQCYAIDFALTWYNKIKKMYDDDYIIIMDRYYTSSLIYQSIDDHNMCNFIKELNLKINKVPEPDLVIYLNVTFDRLMSNINERNFNKHDGSDIFEDNYDLMKKVYDNANRILHEENWIQVDCCNDAANMRNKDEIHDEIKNIVLDKIIKIE